MYPKLGEAERDRRFNRTSRLLDESGLDCLLVFGLHSRHQLQTYLSDCRPRCVVLFIPPDEVIEFGHRDYEVKTHEFFHEHDHESWVSKIVRNPQFGPAIVSEIEEQELGNSRIGVVGVESEGDESEGWVPYNLWNTIVEGLPDADFIDVAFDEFILNKSNQEVTLLERASDAGERICETILAEVQPGVRENKVYADAVKALYSEGASVPSGGKTTPFIFHTAPGGRNLSWGEPPWLYRSYEPRIIRRGDVILAELHPSYSQIEAQQQLTIAIEPVPEETKLAGQIAEASLAKGLSTIEPGIEFGRVAEAMSEPHRDHGVGCVTPLIHTLNPIFAVSWGGVGVVEQSEEGASHNRNHDLVLEENMAIALEPSAVVDGHRVDVGGTIVVTEEGAEALNDISMEMHTI